MRKSNKNNSQATMEKKNQAKIFSHRLEMSQPRFAVLFNK